MILFAILSFFLWYVFFAIKYGECCQDFSRRPSLKEVWSHTLEDKTNRRNARAVKVAAIFFTIFTASSPLVLSGPLSLSDEDYKDTIKAFLLLLLLFNFQGRYILYKEQHLDDKKFSMPVIEILYMYKKTGWFVRNSDFISSSVNSTNIFVIGIVFYLWFFAKS